MNSSYLPCFSRCRSCLHGYYKALAARLATLAHHQWCSLVWWIHCQTCHQGYHCHCSSNFLSSSAKPVTIDHLRLLRNHLNFFDPFDAAVFALTCIAFWSQARLSELLFDRDFDPLMHASKANCEFHQSTSGRKYGRIWAPRMKTRPLGDWLMFMDSSCSCSTLTALQFHLLSSSTTPPLAPLFAFKTTDGSYVPMHRHWFMSHCNDIWTANNHSSLTGHSF